MRFLADENVPFASVLRLRGEGHDVQVVPQGGADSAILALARDEQRVLLTFDRDFGRLVFHRGISSPSGIVYFRTPPSSPESPAEIVLALLTRADAVLAGRFTVVEGDRIRQRPLSSRG